MVSYLMILLIILYFETLEMIMKALGTSKDQEESKEGAQVKMEAQFNSDSEQGSLKSSPRPQTDSDFNDPHMPGKITR
jgi:hypothetical protein